MATICIVGVGYVGLPLAHAFAKTGHVVSGYDTKAERIDRLSSGKDDTNEIDGDSLKKVNITFTTDPSCIAHAEFVIIAVPTPVDVQNNPDLSMVESATRTVGKHLRDGAIIVYESTVYPGVTEELCGPILKKESGGKVFKLGYSPERINPGDKEHTIDKIVKIVAGEDRETLERVADLYSSIITAGVHKAPNIKTAEMAKAIENAQRDLNIAYVNEIALMCNALGIATKEVLKAAGTKWNFLKFSPGLVGGHCIGVDPYYLVEKARKLGVGTHVIAAGRSVNDGMAKYVADRVFMAIRENIPPHPYPLHILVLGLTFKENIPDTRNSKSNEVIEHLKQMGCTVTTHDPFVSATSYQLPATNCYDAILLLVPHKEYLSISPEKYAAALKNGGLFYDLKSVFNAEPFEKAGKRYMAL